MNTQAEIPTSQFTVYPAIDLRIGKVVRLRHGDPDQQTIYSSDPLAVVKAWLDQGVRWLHMINLDGAFGEQESTNYRVIEKIVPIITAYDARVQFGGGLRTLEAIGIVLDLGIERIILGTMAIEEPVTTGQALKLFGPDRVAVSLDALGGYIRVHGWQEGTRMLAKSAGINLYQQGVRWAIYTDISRDGTGSGVDISATAELARATGLNVIASGGVNSNADIIAARRAGLSGIIVGRALYDGRVSIEECLQSMAGAGS